MFPVKDQADSLSDIGNMKHAYKGVIVLDIEGNTKDVRADPESLTLGLSYAYRLGSRNTTLTTGYLPFYHKYDNLPDSYLSILRDVLRSNSGLHMVAHNAKYDLVGLCNNLGIDLKNTDFYCTMLMGHFVNENMPNKGLDAMSRLYGGEPKNKSETQIKIEQNFGYEYVPVDMMTDYSVNDSVLEHGLFWKLLPDFNRQGFASLWEVERDWMRFIIKMEAQGVNINEELCESEIEIGQKRMDQISKDLMGNPGSPKHLEYLLFDKLGLSPRKISEKTGRVSFDKKEMEYYELLLQEKQDHTAQLILEYRGWQKTVSSNYAAYLELLSPDRRLRPNYKLHGTVTSRLSCEKPNLQQIPRTSDKRWNGNLKRAFVAQPGYTLWEADYSNLELRIAAVYSRDNTLLGTFLQGLKPFDVMAARLGWARYICKTFTYTVLYGGGDRRVSAVFGVSLGRARQMRNEFFMAYPGLRDFSQKAASRAKIRGYVKLWTGRRRHFEDPEAEAHKAMNSIFQGGGAEIVKRTGIRLNVLIDWDDCKTVLQIHDSYVFEIKNGTENYWHPIIKETMEDVASYHPDFGTIPFPVDIHKWGEE